PAADVPPGRSLPGRHVLRPRRSLDETARPGSGQPLPGSPRFADADTVACRSAPLNLRVIRWADALHLLRPGEPAECPLLPGLRVASRDRLEAARGAAHRLDHLRRSGRLYPACRVARPGRRPRAPRALPRPRPS